MTKPTVITSAPSDITQTSVKLHGILTADGGHPCYCNFQYYRTKKYWDLTWTPAQGPFTAYQHFEQIITTPIEWYSIYYNALANNEDGRDAGTPVMLWLRHTPPDTYGIPWLIISQQVSNADLQITWVATTDVGCHLTIRVSDRPPYKATELHEKRGTVYYHGTKIKFQWTHQYTQQESGDTLTHTFIFTVPSYNRTYWWYARGTVDGKKSSSRSPFFNYYIYHLEPPPVIVAAQSNCTRCDNRVYDCHYPGVTFWTPAHTYKLTTITLHLSKAGNPADVTIALREAEAHLPIGSNLCSRTLSGAGLPPWDYTYHSCGTLVITTIDFSAEEVMLQPSREYAIILSSPDTIYPDNQIVIGGILGPYDLIYHIYSNDYGSSWLVSTYHLPYFQAYGIQQD